MLTKALGVSAASVYTAPRTNQTVAGPYGLEESPGSTGQGAR